MTPSVPLTNKHSVSMRMVGSLIMILDFPPPTNTMYQALTLESFSPHFPLPLPTKKPKHSPSCPITCPTPFNRPLSFNRQVVAQGPHAFCCATLTVWHVCCCAIPPCAAAPRAAAHQRQVRGDLRKRGAQLWVLAPALVRQ